MILGLGLKLHMILMSCEKAVLLLHTVFQYSLNKYKCIGNLCFIRYRIAANMKASMHDVLSPARPVMTFNTLQVFLISVWYSINNCS